MLLRHGASTANTAGSFGGWEDVPLAQLGVEQALAAGAAMKSRGLRFDCAFTSVLRRATTTAWHVLDALEQHWIGLSCDWRLNERHYGVLQGMSKAAAVAEFGADQVLAWRRGFYDRPPSQDSLATQAFARDRRYETLLPGQMPSAESLADTVARVAPCWHELIAPRLDQGNNALVVAHGNSIRALLILLLGMDEAQIQSVEVPNAVPIPLSWRRGRGADVIGWSCEDPGVIQQELGYAAAPDRRPPQRGAA